MPFKARVVIPRQLGSLWNVSWAVWNRDVLLDFGWVDASQGATFDASVTVHDTAGDVLYAFAWVGSDAAPYNTTRAYRAMPGVLCLLPPLTAMVLVVVLREATLGLFFGVFMGSMLLALFNPLQGFLDSISVHFVAAWYVAPIASGASLIAAAQV